MDESHLQSKPHPPVQMPVYDANMQRFQKGQHRRAIDLANKATQLATSKLAGPLGGWVMPSRAKRAAVGAPHGAAQYYPGNRSLAAPKQHYPDTAPGPGTVPAQLVPIASFPALPSQQEFAAALAQGPMQHLGAPEPYDPLRHGLVAQQVHSSSGGPSTFQFAAGAAQPMPAMRPVSIHQTETGTRAPPSQAGHPLAAAATRESAEQAAAQFFQSLSQQGIQGGPGGSSNSPVQPAGQATVNQANEDGMPASTVAANAQTNGVKGPDAEGGVALVDVIVWRRGQWVGPSPREHLLEWSLKHTVTSLSLIWARLACVSYILILLAGYHRLLRAAPTVL